MFREYLAHRQLHGDTSTIPTPNFFYGLQPGQEISIEIERGKTLMSPYHEAVSKRGSGGTGTGQRSRQGTSAAEPVVLGNARIFWSFWRFSRNARRYGACEGCSAVPRENKK